MRNMIKPTEKDLLAVARSYYEAGDKLIYSVKANTFLSGSELFDQEHGGRGRIDCSTYIHLILQGISYEKSPYVSGAADDFYRTDCPWAFREIAELLWAGRGQGRRQPLRRAYQLAKYFWDQGKARTDDKWRSGDLLFFQVRPEKVDFYLSFDIFQAIYHIGIAAEDCSEMYESSGNQTVNIEENYNRPGIRMSSVAARRKPLFYVRLTEE